jgi:hypothetical protein
LRGWTLQEGIIPAPEGLKGAVYHAADLFLPRPLWSLIFFVSDSWTFYYVLYLTFSVLGNFMDPHFFAFHVLDLAVRIKLLRYVMQVRACRDPWPSMTRG